MAKAVTNIRYGVKRDQPVEVGPGLSSDYENKTIFAGADADKGLFSDDEWKELVEIGAVVEQDDEYPPAGSPAATGPLLDTHLGSNPDNAREGKELVDPAPASKEESTPDEKEEEEASKEPTPEPEPAPVASSRVKRTEASS